MNVPKLTTAVVDTVDPHTGEPGHWAYPVAEGAPEEVVKAEIKAMLDRDGVAATSLGIRYPTGQPFAGRAKPDEVIGLQWYDQNRPQQPSVDGFQGVSAGPQSRRVPPQGGSGTAPPRNPAQFSYGPAGGSLPNNAQPPRDGFLSAALDQALAGWAGRGEVTSAEFYFHLAGALARHAKHLVQQEARTGHA